MHITSLLHIVDWPGELPAAVYTTHQQMDPSTAKWDVTNAKLNVKNLKVIWEQQIDNHEVPPAKQQHKGKG